MEEDMEQIGCSASSCCLFEATVVSNWFWFSFQVYIQVEKTLPEGSLSLNTVGWVLSFMFTLGSTSCLEYMGLHSFEALQLPVRRFFL